MLLIFHRSPHFSHPQPLPLAQWLKRWQKSNRLYQRMNAGKQSEFMTGFIPPLWLQNSAHAFGAGIRLKPVVTDLLCPLFSSILLDPHTHTNTSTNSNTLNALHLRSLRCCEDKLYWQPWKITLTYGNIPQTSAGTWKMGLFSLG